MFDEALADLDLLYRGGSLSKACHKSFVEAEDVARWAQISGISVPEVLDHVGIELARAYASGAQTWEYCDWAANQLFRIHAEQDDEAAQFWKFYLAFDLSENFLTDGEAEQVAHREIAVFLASVPVDSA